MKWIITLGLMVSLQLAQAQNGPRMNIADRMEREKQMMYDSISGLNQDQKLLMDQVYKELSASVQALMDTSSDMSVMREQMPVLQEKKNAAMKDILSAEQYERYTDLMSRMRMRRRGNRGNQ